MHVKLTLIMKDGSCEKARVTDCNSAEEAISFMKEMRPGVDNAVVGWERAERWEAEQAQNQNAEK